ncbi:hypothetical protein COEREDRAFT_83665 [Coemansia reversa NRRL 1564]|uniref:Uncharacterized protein n=1 Tax=Coemansia reversa (strain ATCC 12441 / NRRL 1564) TaxID=763665 RepID=A0A2G5B2C7_COERN|nr:hypothetical protein COEREDRAFT_83665 [Coemansia reversa NRRL 1564]|eukprot:PIA13169.1 hypothetical protein COEREDRAFT_83665 [Coemansia reversa NRRL 1564]
MACTCADLFGPVCFAGGAAFDTLAVFTTVLFLEAGTAGAAASPSDAFAAAGAAAGTASEVAAGGRVKSMAACGS